METLNIKDILKILKNRASVIIITVLITTIGSIILTYFFIKPIYLTTAKLFIGMPTINDDGSGNSSWDFSYYKQLIEPYSEIIKSDELSERAIKRGKLNISQQALSNSLMVDIGSGQVMKLSIYTINSKDGVKILDAVIEEFIETSSKLITKSNVSVLSHPKYPIAPVSPNKPKNIIFGFCLGLALGISLVLIMNYFDNSVKGKEDIEEFVGLPLIGLVPMCRKKKKRKTVA
ncbi:MAG: Wzz/FepE/Etk N-terminal domain-containing protein [Clostridium sp.]|nr:Wzz/FepE/Etk N-terminal domain-containing protein [Clostridium sp.]MCI7441756.1 Wzz/FepE/Etk N-terminal domain-containing protein [Clostridium sp.]